MSTVSRIMDMINNLDLPENEIKDILKELRTTVEERILRPSFEDWEHPESTGLFKSVYRIEVLSDENWTSNDLENINYQITEGHSSGVVTLVASGELTAEEMSKELTAQGSDPEFFGLETPEEGDIN
jgi:hypothetical protein